MASDAFDDAKRRFETARTKVGKVGYLGGNGNEKEYARSYAAFAAINNSTEGQPHIMLPKKKYRS